MLLCWFNINSNNKTYLGLYAMCLIYLPDLNHISIVSMGFLKSPKYQSSQRSIQWGGIDIYRQTWRSLQALFVTANIAKNLSVRNVVGDYGERPVALQTQALWICWTHLVLLNMWLFCCFMPYIKHSTMTNFMDYYNVCCLCCRSAINLGITAVSLKINFNIYNL